MKKVPKRQINEILSTVNCPSGCACYDVGLKNKCLSEFTTFTRFPRYTQLPCRQPDVPCKMKVHLEEEAFCRCPVRINIIRRISNLAAIIPTERENGEKEE